MAVVVLRPLYRVSPRGEEGISWLDEPTSPTASVFLFMAPFCLIKRKFDGIEDEVDYVLPNDGYSFSPKWLADIILTCMSEER